MSSTASPVGRLPCVVQLGFAGSRYLYPEAEKSPELDAKLELQLREVLRRLPNRLRLEPHHFFCGISQLAIGGDMLFTRACAAEGVSQRIFLPQPRDVFFSAMGSAGNFDFSAGDRAEAEMLLASPHIIQERVVSDAADRHTRFEDSNREILRVSDVVIGLVQEDAGDKPGGTRDLVRLAIHEGKPTLELRVRLDGTEPRLEETMYNFDQSGWCPSLPDQVADLPAPQDTDRKHLPTVDSFCDVVKTHSSREAQRHREVFTRAALIIIATHILATLFATLVLAFHESHDLSESHGVVAHSDVGHPSLIWVSILMTEVILLSIGFATHQRLHHVRATGDWALSRLLAEIHRSVNGVGELHMYLDYLFRLRLPSRFRSLLRTINVLHLRTTRTTPQDVKALRQKYRKDRITDKKTGQINYFRTRSQSEERLLKIARKLFLVCSSLAILATASKIAVLLLWPEQHSLMGLLGTMAVLLPVLAVGAMSWAAAKDYEARVAIYEEMADWLEDQSKLFEHVDSLREFQRLVSATELRLLSETTEWYSRRSFTGVA